MKAIVQLSLVVGWVVGMDDAEKAQWIPIAELDSSVCFEDHAEILNVMLGV